MIEIIKWSESFESSDTRKRQRLGWFLSPSGCDSKGFRKLMRDPNGLSALGLFQALCQAMATQNITTRSSGTFQNSDGSFMDLEDIFELSRVGGRQLADNRQDIGRLVACGWIRLHNSLVFQQSATYLPPICHLSPSFVQGEGEGEGKGKGKGKGEEENLFFEQEIPTSEKPSNEILPDGWNRISKTEQGRKKVLRNTPLMIRIGNFFGQRESTLWTIADYIALEDVHPSDEDLDLIEAHYSLELENNGYRITCIQTLLNQWPKARSKAAIYFSENPTHR